MIDPTLLAQTVLIGEKGLAVLGAGLGAGLVEVFMPLADRVALGLRPSLDSLFLLAGRDERIS